MDSVYLDMAEECKRLFDVSDVKIVFVDEVRPNEPNLWGVYRWWDKSIIVKKRADILSMLETICHEIVHHIQYRNGELFFGTYSNGIRVSRYKGIDYTVVTEVTGKVTNEVTYWNSPWEVEARKYQVKMFERFVAKAPYKLVQRIHQLAVGN